MPKAEAIPDQLTLTLSPDQVVLLHRAVELLSKRLQKEPLFDYHNNAMVSPTDAGDQLIKTGNQLLWLAEFDRKLTGFCHANGWRPYPHFRYA
jgi:hypothetical protein